MNVIQPLQSIPVQNRYLSQPLAPKSAPETVPSRLTSLVSQCLNKDSPATHYKNDDIELLQQLEFPDTWEIEKQVSLGNFELLCKLNGHSLQSVMNFRRPELQGKPFSFVLDAQMNVQLHDPSHALTKEDRAWLQAELDNPAGLFSELKLSGYKTDGAIKQALQTSKTAFETRIKEFCQNNDCYLSKESVDLLHQQWSNDTLNMAFLKGASGVDIWA